MKTIIHDHANSNFLVDLDKAKLIHEGLLSNRTSERVKFFSVLFEGRTFYIQATINGFSYHASTLSQWELILFLKDHFHLQPEVIANLLSLPSAE